jgi:hypothetical protein
MSQGSIPLHISVSCYTLTGHLDILFTVSLLETDRYVMALLCAELLLTASRTTNMGGS